ncbi:MAG: phospholipase D-like domain-containing protein [Pyrinomonadaceae bacterium]|nr:phospholipase D-like domain-containing protein [Pyrinomonadaceae bacterium]
MRSPTLVKPAGTKPVPLVDESFVNDSFQRVTGAELISGNDIRLLVDATENYPAWLSAIESAQKTIFFESYIIHGDKQGAIFSDVLIEKAKSGVEVKLIYDWMGGFGKTPRRFWRHLMQNGVDVRCYNPPKLTDPLGFFSRDHRKTMVVDDRIAFVSGLCVGQDWVGYPDQGVPPWRDTGVQITGPAVAVVTAAFAAVWATLGTPIDERLLFSPGDIPISGATSLRVVQSSPGAAYIYRTDQLLAVAARESMWIADAYFVGIPSYLQSLKDAAHAGVDVRILVPQSTDIGLIRDTTRSTYRPLLEAGVRVFEWNGPMMHAKTAVFDGRFSRVGSTNLNVASWFGNYELDVLVEDTDFGSRMREMFLSDIENSTEIVLSMPVKVRRSKSSSNRHSRKGGGSMRKATAGALNAATSIGSALTKKSKLGAAEARLLFIVGMALLIMAILLIFFPRIASIPLIALLLMLAIPTLINAIKSYRKY